MFARKSKEKRCVIIQKSEQVLKERKEERNKK